jgi:hypothetical protein
MTSKMINGDDNNTFTECNNSINGEYVESTSNENIDILNPCNNKTIGKVCISNDLIYKMV